METVPVREALVAKKQNKKSPEGRTLKRRKEERKGSVLVDLHQNQSCFFS